MPSYPCASPQWDRTCTTSLPGGCINGGGNNVGCDENSVPCSDCYQGEYGGGVGGILGAVSNIENDENRTIGFATFFLTRLSQPLIDAGLQPGDMIMRVGDDSVTHPADTLAALEAPGEKFVKYFRMTGSDGGETICTTVNVNSGN